MENMITFISQAGKLKKVKRSGWQKLGIKNSESVADHSWRLSIMCMILGQQLKVDINKIIIMALIDDLAESTVGDLITTGPQKQIPREQKIQKEATAIKEIFSPIKNGRYYIKLWEEAQAGKTKEAKALKQLDKLEMIFQALEYETRLGKNNKFDQFWQTAQSQVNNPTIKKLFKQLLIKRP